MAKLGDVFTLIRNGASIKQTEGAGGFPITRIETIANREVDRKKFGYANIVDISKYESYILQDGDILMSHINSEKHLGKVALYKKQGNEQIIHGMNLLLLRANPKILLPSYAAYYFETPSFLGQIQRITKKSVNQASFTVTALKEVGIPLPSLDNQRHIVAILDKVTDLIAQRRAQLDKLDLLVKSRFVEMFGATGKQVPLADYVWFQEGPGVRSVDFTEEGTILLTGSNINNNTITFGHKSDRHISNELANGKYKHFMCDKDDILVVSSAIDPDKFDKKVVIVDSNKKYCLNTGIIRFKPDKKFLTLGYFREFLKTDYFKHQVSSEMRGIAQMHFGPSHLKRMTILLPDSLEKQIEFYSFIKQTDKSKLTIHKSLDKLEMIKKALMQNYFG